MLSAVLRRMLSREFLARVWARSEEDEIFGVENPAMTDRARFCFHHLLAYLSVRSQRRDQAAQQTHERVRLSTKLVVARRRGRGRALVDRVTRLPAVFALLQFL